MGALDDASLPRVTVRPRAGDEPFHRGSEAMGFSAIDFWRWAFSDLVSNATRGVLAEFIVAQALDASDGVRTEWDGYDLTTTEGIKVEVKSAAYVQSWAQARLSRIEFGIQPSQQLARGTNAYDGKPRRPADVYVFCLLDHRDQETLDPLDVSQWRFFVLATQVLDEAKPSQKKLALSSLLELAPAEVAFGGIARAVRDAAGPGSPGPGSR